MVQPMAVCSTCRLAVHSSCPGAAPEGWGGGCSSHPYWGFAQERAQGLNRSTALGSDLVSLGDFLDAPPEAFEDLAQLFRCSEGVRAFPLQLLCSLMVALDKGDGSERRIALLPASVRAYFKARKAPVQEWSAGHAAFL